MKKHLLSLAAAIALCGATQAQNTKFEYIESGVTLRLMAPVAEGGARKFVLLMQTNDVYECDNTTILNSVQLQGNKLLIKAKGVEIPDPCPPKMGPAKCRLDLSSLKPGKYPVRVTINRDLFKASLEITPEYYDFKISPNEDPSLFRIYNGRLNLIPDGHVWGVCEYHDPAQKTDALKFMKTLEEAGAAKTQLAPGNYDDFYLHTPGTTEEKVIAADKYEFPFVYQYKGDLERIKEILNAFNGKVKVTFRDSKGNVLKNF